MKVKEIVLIPFDVEIATEADWEEMLDLREELRAESHPDDPAPSRELMRQGWERIPDNPHSHVKLYGIRERQTNRLIGVTAYGHAKENSPDYENNRHVAWATINLLPACRRRGYGTEVLRFLVEQWQSIDGVTVIECETNKGSGEQFCEKYGGEIAIRSRTSRCYLADVDWQMIEQWYAESSAIAARHGVTMERFEGMIAEPEQETYVQLFNEVFNQQPYENLEAAETTTTVESMSKFHEDQIRMGGRCITYISREADGTISGLTEILYNPKQAHQVNQLLTGVKEEYRGRKLGKWLKSAMILYIRENFPDVQFIDTTNANSNAPMLAINESLGFKLYKQNTAYKFKLDELLQKLNA